MAPRQTLADLVRACLSEFKLWNWLVKALAELRTKAPNQYNDLQLVIIGANKETKAVITKLTEQIKQLGLADHVTFTGERRDIAQLASCEHHKF